MFKTTKAASVLSSTDLLFRLARAAPRTRPLRTATPPKRPRVATVEAVRVVDPKVTPVRTAPEVDRTSVASAMLDKAKMVVAATIMGFILQETRKYLFVAEEMSQMVNLKHSLRSYFTTPFHDDFSV